MPSLVLENVSKRFGGVEALSDVSFVVPPAGIVGLIGPNGAGKTTVVNLITGMFSLSAGRIMLGDQNLGLAPPHLVAQAGVSRTFQNIRLLPEASVLANVVIGFYRHENASLLASALGLPSARRETARLRDQARALLDRFHMGRFADHPAGSLAYGHQRRVEMMRAIASQPAILLLDEPVAGMNDVEANELGEIFSQLAADGMGLLLIEHNIRFVKRLCSTIHVLDTGRMLASGSPAEVLGNASVIAAYLGAA